MKRSQRDRIFSWMLGLPFVVEGVYWFANLVFEVSRGSSLVGNQKYDSGLIALGSGAIYIIISVIIEYRRYKAVCSEKEDQRRFNQQIQEFQKKNIQSKSPFHSGGQNA